MSRRPERAPNVDPTACDRALTERTTAERMSALGRIGGQTRVANMTEAELSADMRARRAIRTERDRARREAAGLPPSKPTPKMLTDDELAYWLSVVDERYPEREYSNRMQRRRLAIRLAREEAARIAERAFREQGRPTS